MTLIGYDSDTFLSALGSFWSTIFEDKDFMKNIVLGQELKIADAYMKFCEMILGEAINDIPVFNKENWANVVFKESQIDQDIENAIRYGDEDVQYGDGFFYGGKWPDTDMSFSLPSEMIDTGEFICNKVYNPSLVLSKNYDFFVRNGVVHFTENLFENDLIPIRNIADENGDIIDREISLWIPLAIFDKQFLWKRYGILTGIYQRTSEEYKLLLKNIFALFFIGPKKRLINGYVNQIFGLPVTKHENEVVNYIEKDIQNDNATIYTNLETYNVEPLSALHRDIIIGAELLQFSPISKAIEILDEDVQPGWWKNNGYFSIPEKFLESGYLSPAIVKNEMITLQNKVGAQTKLPVYGEKTEDLQNRLDGYTIHVGIGVKVGDTEISINVLDYLIGQLKDNLFGIKLDPTIARFSYNIDSALFDILNRSLPVNISYVLFLEIESLEDEYDIDSVVEEIELLDGFTLSDTIITGVDVKDGFWGVAKVGGGFHVGDTFVGEIKYSEYPYLQESIKD